MRVQFEFRLKKKVVYGRCMMKANCTYVCSSMKYFGPQYYIDWKIEKRNLKKDIEIKFFNPKVGLNYFVEKQNEIASKILN